MPFHSALVDGLVARAKRTSFASVNDDMLPLLRPCYEGMFGQSLVCENMIRVAREDETRGQSNSEARYDRVWRRQAQQGILQDRFQYREAPWRQMDMRAGHLFRYRNLLPKRPFPRRWGRGENKRTGSRSRGALQRRACTRGRSMGHLSRR